MLLMTKTMKQYDTLRQASETGEIVIDNVCLKFGGVQALSNVSIDITQREVLAIIGPNGAGKTALVNCVSGFYRPQEGKVLFNDQDITRFSPHKIAQMGIARTFQNIELYTGLTTQENVLAGRHIHMRSGAVAGGIYWGWAQNEDERELRIVEEIIDFLEIEPIRKLPVGILPYGLRKRVELGRALALEPRILILDEPMAGMNLEEKEDMARFIVDIYELRRIPIILIEHDMGVVMDISDRVVVLDFGRKIAEGTPKEIQCRREVIEAYLGEEA